MVINWFKFLYAVGLVVVGGYWIYSIYPIPWTEFLSILSFDKAGAQKSAPYSLFFSVALILYGIFEIRNAISKNS